MTGDFSVFRRSSSVLSKGVLLMEDLKSKLTAINTHVASLMERL
jgi:hypothetical protein